MTYSLPNSSTRLLRLLPGTETFFQQKRPAKYLCHRSGDEGFKRDARSSQSISICKRKGRGRLGREAVFGKDRVDVST